MFLVKSVGLCVGATVMDFKKSIVVAAVYGLTCMLLGGFYQKHIPSWLAWFQYSAVITYSYDAVLSMEFTNSPSFRSAEIRCNWSHFSSLEYDFEENTFVLDGN